MGFWDDPAVKPNDGGWMKFTDVGDTVTGVVKSLGLRTFDEGTARERKAVEVTFEDEVPSVTAGQVLLQRALYEAKPVVGDTLTITLVGIEKNGNKTLKKFRVVLVRKDGGETFEVDQAT